MATKKELIEIIEFLTEQCVNKIAYDLNDIAFTPYMAKEEDWEGTLNPASVEVHNYYERVRSYFINQLLVKDKKELTEEEYQQLLDKYELKFVEKFGEALTDKFLDDDSEYVEEDNINDIEDEDISDEQYDVFEEQMEDVFIDINNIFSNVNDIEHNVNYYFPSELKIKEEIFSILKEIEEKTDTLLEKIYKLVYYMK